MSEQSNKQEELLDRLITEMDKCLDCPKDEPPSLHLQAEKSILEGKGQ